MKISDEALHLRGTEFMINTLRKTPMFKDIWEEEKETHTKIFMDVVEGEKLWSGHLFAPGSMLGLNKMILDQFVEYMANVRMSTIDLGVPFPNQMENPCPWVFTKGYLSSPNVQTAPQETENADYITGLIDGNIAASDFDDFDLD